MAIEQEISDWDGKSADEIRQVYDRHARSSSFYPDALNLIRSEPLQNGATWLLKRHVEKTGPPESSTARMVYESLPFLSHWEAKLHILQIVPYLPVPADCLHAVESFVRQCLVSDIKFVRAWAYSGFTSSQCSTRSTARKPSDYSRQPVERNRHPYEHGSER